MANITDPLICAAQGSDPQNLMEYITRQKIYDSRFWKEECFGLTVVDVLEKAATSLSCVGGTMGANQQPTRFLCLTLKLLQLQPESDLIQDEFIQPKSKIHAFKYVRALGAFYLRLTGRPADIYESLEPLYEDYSKLKLRQRNEWELIYMDQVVHDLLTQGYFCGITLPRLPARETLEQEGYLEAGPRETALQEALAQYGGLEEYLQHKAQVEKSPAAMDLWKERRPEKGELDKQHKGTKAPVGEKLADDEEEGEVGEQVATRMVQESNKRKASTDDEKEKKKKKKSRKGKDYGTLFKSRSNKSRDTDPKETHDTTTAPPPEEGSDEFWNEQRAKLGLKPLNAK